MSEPVVTEADREKAREVILAGEAGPESWTQILAAALAAERDKARDVFRELADEFDERRAVYANAATGSHDDGINKAYWVAADRIRRAAEGTL